MNYNNIKNNLKVFHPFAIALFPILYLYGYNKELVHPSYMLWPLIITMLLSIAILLLFEHFFRNFRKSALLASFFLITFFSFGHYLNTMHLLSRDAVNSNLVYYIFLFCWIFLFFSVIWLVKNSKKNFSKTTVYLNIVSLILLAMPLATIFWYEFNSKDIDELITQHNSLKIDQDKAKPDIYYLVLDAYARQDVLEQYYGFDNSQFINELEKLGFYVARSSHSNYPQTYLSMASSLNDQYLDDLSQSMGKESDDRGPLRDMVKDSSVLKSLRDAGYKIVAFPYTWTGTYKNVDADIFMQNKINNTEFVEILIQSTPLRIFSNTDLVLEGYRDKTRFAFDRLPSVARVKAPTFTYVHLVIPHPPFVFDENGNNVKIEGRVIEEDGSHYFKTDPDVNNYKRKYVQQLQFASDQMLNTIKGILANSPKQPVIILQSDHGPGSMLDWEDEKKTNMHERLSILNAYYLPAKGEKMLYDSITPVNSFRVVFNALFDSNLELLEDRSYFAKWSHPYDFFDVTERLN